MNYRHPVACDCNACFYRRVRLLFGSIAGAAVLIFTGWVAFVAVWLMTPGQS